jgi:hypothetical protein
VELQLISLFLAIQENNEKQCQMILNIHQNW